MGNGMLRGIPRVVVLFVTALVAACGGGGGGTTSPTPTPPPAAVTSLAPASANAGSGATLLTVTGSGFTSTSTIDWDGTALPTTYVSSTSLTATIPATDLSVPGSGSVTVSDVSSAALSFTVAALPVPTLVSVSPASMLQNQGNVTLTLTGTNFTSTTQASVSGAGVGTLKTTYVSSTQLSVSFTAPTSVPASGSTLTLAVTDPLSANKASNTLSVAVTSALPAITGISPSTVYVNQGSLTLTLSGQFFSPTAVVYVNGASRPTAFDNGQLLAALTAADVSVVGSVAITVEDSASGNVPSTAATLTVQARPTVGIISLSPGTLTAGNTSFTLTVTGFGFAADSVIDWNGTGLTTTYVSATTLSAAVPASQVAAVGTAQVNVVNPANEGGTSNTQNANIVAPSIDAVSVQINNAHTGAVNFKSASLPTAAAWTVNVGNTPTYALIVSNIVYVVATQPGAGVASQLFALDGATGKTVWGPVNLPGSAAITYDSGMLFAVDGAVSPDNAQVTALDAATGSIKWTTPVSGQFPNQSPPVASQGLVYELDDGALTVLNELTGVAVWGDGVTGSNGSVAVTADGVYLAQPCTAIDYQPLLGTRIWAVNTGCEGGGGDTPVVANGQIYAPINTPPSYQGNVYDAESGILVTPFSYFRIPAVTATTTYALSNGTLQSINWGTSQVNWTFAGDGGLTTPPIVVNNYVFVGSTSGNLYGVDATSGSLLWTQNMGAAIPTATGWAYQDPSGLAAGDGLLVVPAGNTVSAFVLSADP